MAQSTSRVTESGPVLIVIEQGIATVTLNRPHRMNAFDTALHAALRDALDRVEADPAVRVLILTGAGKGFCAGQDLAERAASFADGDVPDLGTSLRENYNPLVRRIATMPIPVIAAVNGIAAGAGAALAIGCDIVLAADSARFQFAFAKVGLGPDSGTSWLLPRIVGQTRALALALTADPVSAPDAERMGLVWRVVPDADLAEEARSLARRLASTPAPALSAIKQQLRASATQSFEQSLDAERAAQQQLGRSAAYRDAVERFTRPRAAASPLV